MLEPFRDHFGTILGLVGDLFGICLGGLGTDEEDLWEVVVEVVGTCLGGLVSYVGRCFGKC